MPIKLSKRLTLQKRMAALAYHTQSECSNGWLKESEEAGDLDLACTAIESIARADDYLDANVSIPIIFQQLALALTRLTAA